MLLAVVPSALPSCVHTSGADSARSPPSGEVFDEEAIFAAYRPSYQRDYRALKARFALIHDAIVAKERSGIPIWCLEQMEDEATMNSLNSGTP